MSRFSLIMEKDILPYTISVSKPSYGLLWARTVTVVLASCVLMCVTLLCMHVYFIREVPEMQNKIGNLTEHLHYASEAQLSANNQQVLNITICEIHIVYNSNYYLGSA